MLGRWFSRGRTARLPRPRRASGAEVLQADPQAATSSAALDIEPDGCPRWPPSGLVGGFERSARPAAPARVHRRDGRGGAEPRRPPDPPCGWGSWVSIFPLASDRTAAAPADEQSPSAAETPAATTAAAPDPSPYDNAAIIERPSAADWAPGGAAPPVQKDRRSSSRSRD